MPCNLPFVGSCAPPYVSQYDPTLYEASSRRRFAIPAVVVTTATPVAPLRSSAFSLPRKNSKIVKLKLPKQSSARGVTKPASRPHTSLRHQPVRAIKLVPPYNFYYPAQTLGNLPPAHLLDPRLFAPPQPATTYSELILPQLRELISNIKSTEDIHLMTHLPRLIDLVGLLSQFPDFGLGPNNLPSFRKHVESFFSTAHTKEEAYYHDLLSTKPEKDLKIVFKIFDDLYTYNFPHRAACLIYPDHFEHKPDGEVVSEELACLCPDQWEADVDLEMPAMVYRQGWGGKARYVVTASFAGDVGVQYPVYY